MIGFHIQNSPPDWPRAVSKLPAAAPVKFCTGVERSSEAWEANPDCHPWYRWVGPQPLPAADFEAHARAWLNNFIDGTFRREAGFVDYTQEYNETLANSQSAEEKARWIALHTAMAKVWYEEYRQEEELSHIKMILCETAIGNDIPIEIALAAVKYDALLGYHPYQVCRLNSVRLTHLTNLYIRHDAPRASFRGDTLYKMLSTATVRSKNAAFEIQESAVPVPEFVSPHDWRWYSGRWAFMDAEFAAQGVRPTWAFGEMGPVLDASPDWSGWLDPMGGWKHKDCLNRDFDKYLQVQKYWLDNVMQTEAYQEGRILGGTLFTSGAPGSGPNWSNFDLQQPEMDRLADFVRTYDYTPTQPPIDPPPPPIDPPPPPTEKNLLVNPSFEYGWTDISGQAQQPNGWWLDLAANGVDVRGRPVKGQPECTHKDKELLPPDEWPGAENALILDGEWTFKLHHGGTTWKADLSQTVKAEPGSKQRLIVPVNVHFDERPDPYDPQDTLIELGVNEHSTQLWMKKENDRTWQYPSLDVVVSDDGTIRAWIAISVKWEHPTSIFFDDLQLEPIEEPPPPDPCPGRPRIDYKRTFHVLPYPATFSQLQQVTAEAYPNRQTVGFSYDDAGIGDLTNKTAILWGIAETDKTRFLAWYKEHYPGTRVLFADFEEPGIFVDVSRHQGDIDWRQMKAQGVTHCYIRASRGSSVEDRKYQENAASCREAGIRFGAYHFFSYSTKGMAQGEFFYECIKEDPGDLPPAIDFENTGQIAEPDPFQLRNCLSTVESLTGRVPVIYTNLVQIEI